jgi:hypothetical protein
MDRAIDGGIGWRRNIVPWLHDRGVIVFDPTNKPIDEVPENEDERSERQTWKKTGQWDKLSKFVRSFRTVDLRMVDVVDFLIVVIDLDVYACGTMEELFWANRMKKPVLIWCVQGKEHAPDWLFGTIPHEHIFGSQEELLEYLDHIDTARRVKTFRRWFFFKQEVLYNPKVLKRLGGVYEGGRDQSST